jgi:hypothetical protein
MSKSPRPHKKNAALYPGQRLAAVVDRSPPPPEVLEERDRALAQPRSTFGDPPIGRRAIDKPPAPRVTRVTVDPASVQRIMKMRARRQRQAVV